MDLSELNEMGLSVRAVNNKILILAELVRKNTDFSSDTIEGDTTDINFFQNAVRSILAEVNSDIVGLFILSFSGDGNIDETVVVTQTFINRVVILVVGDTHQLSIGNESEVSSLSESSNQGEFVIQINTAQEVGDILSVDDGSVSDESGQSGIQGSVNGDMGSSIVRNSFTSVEIEPLGSSREVDGGSSGTFVNNSGNHEFRSNEELSLETQKSDIIREIEEEGSEDRTDLLVSNEDGVVILQD
jgi:hypothetical protein